MKACADLVLLRTLDDGQGPDGPELVICTFILGTVVLRTTERTVTTVEGREG